MRYLSAANFINYNANSRNSRTGDCVKRSMSLAFDIPYNILSKQLNSIVKEYGGAYDDYASKRYYEKLITQLGGSQYISTKSNNMTLENFCDNYAEPELTYLVVVGRPNGSRSNHMVCVMNCDVYDNWNSMNSKVFGYYEIKGRTPFNKSSDILDKGLELSNLMQDEIQNAADRILAKMITYPYEFRINYCVPDGYALVSTCTLYATELDSNYRFKIAFAFRPDNSYKYAVDIIQSKIYQKVYDKLYEINKKIKHQYEMLELE